MERFNRTERIGELDFLKGIALLLMIYFHLIFDLNAFLHLPVSYTSGIHFYIGKTAAILFILISGMNANFSENLWKRGLKVLGLGLVISFVSQFFGPDYVVRFGILHFLGVGMCLFSFLKYLQGWFLILLSVLIWILGRWVLHMRVQSPYLFPLGLMQEGFVSSDYYPLIPWFALYLLGTVLGRAIYKTRQTRFSYPLQNHFLSKCGRHSLILYLLHQPILIVLMLGLKKMMMNG
jgi:uncharacterized membrane protein